jgi:hypothetical protein
MSKSRYPFSSKTVSTTDTEIDVSAHSYIEGFSSTNAATDYPSIGDKLEIEIVATNGFVLSKTVSSVKTYLYPSTATTQTSGTLVSGGYYEITSFVAGDDFTNVGAGSNATGVQFEATGTTPTTYTNGSTLTRIDQQIARSTEFDTQGYTVWFYDEPGGSYNTYHAGDTWTYTRSELPYESTYNETHFSRASYAYDLYLVISDGSVLRYRDGVLSSIGSHEPVKGDHVEIFANKLYVSKLGFTFDDDYRIGNSALDDPNLWYYGTFNEAGEKNFFDNFDASQPTRGVTGLKSWQNQIFAFFSSAIHQGTYVGVQQGTTYWNQIRSDLGSVFPKGVIRSKSGIYFISNDLNFYRLSSEGLAPVGNPVHDKFREEVVPRTSDSFPKTFGFYNPKESEISWIYYWVDSSGNERQKQITYMEDTGQWYFRKIPNETTDEGAKGDITEIELDLLNTYRFHYGAKNYFYKDYREDDCRVEDVLQEDIATSTAAEETIAEGAEIIVVEGDEWIIPTTTPATAFVLTTHDLTYDTSRPHDLESFWLDAGWTQGSGVTIEVSVRDRISAPIVWTELGTWTPELVEQIFDQFNSLNGRVFRYRFTVDPDENSALVHEFILRAWTDNIRGAQLQIER